MTYLLFTNLGLYLDGSRWDRPVATLQTSSFPALLALHAFDPHLVVANEVDKITVFDWTKRKRLSQFYNGNPRGTSITSLHLINQDVGGIILTGAGMYLKFPHFSFLEPTNIHTILQPMALFVFSGTTTRKPVSILSRWSVHSGHLRKSLA